MDERHALTLLREAYDCFQAVDIDGYTGRLTEAKQVADTLPERETLYGEILLIAALPDMFDLSAAVTKYREATRRLGGRSRVLPPRAELFGQYANPFGICNRALGEAAANADRIAELVELHFALTGGGRGTDICYRAQLALYRGELSVALELGKTAFETAQHHGQGLTALCAADVLAQVAKHTCDSSLWSYASSYITAIANGKVAATSACHQLAQVLHANLSLSIGLIGSIPEWIRLGDFGAISAPWGVRLVDDRTSVGSLSHALCVKIQYHLYKGDPVQTLNTIDLAQTVFGIDNMLVGIYYEFFRAGSYVLLGDDARRDEALRRALALLIPDELYRIAAEFAPTYGDILYELAAEVNEGAPAHIHGIGNDYLDKLSLFRERSLDRTAQDFTKRESEVALLIAAGKTNAEIAAELCISERTVEKHAANVFSKLSINRRSHVADAVKKNQPPEIACWVDND